MPVAALIAFVDWTEPPRIWNLLLRWCCVVGVLFRRWSALVGDDQVFGCRVGPATVKTATLDRLYEASSAAEAIWGVTADGGLLRLVEIGR
ncbi:hypothetical protein GCM10027186_00240 [Micromonospora schwarzwaldensis]